MSAPLKALAGETNGFVSVPPFLSGGADLVCVLHYRAFAKPNQIDQSNK